MRDLLLHMEEISILRAPQLCYFNSSRAALFLSDRDIWHRLWSCYWTLMPIRITVNRSSSSRERTGDITLGPAHKNTFQITCDNKRQRLTENTKSTNGEHCVVTTSIERGGRTRASQEMCNKSICVKLSLRCRHTHELAWWEVSMEFHGCCKNQKKKVKQKRRNSLHGRAQFKHVDCSSFPHHLWRFDEMKKKEFFLVCARDRQRFQGWNFSLSASCRMTIDDGRLSIEMEKSDQTSPYNAIICELMQESSSE